MIHKCPHCVLLFALTYALTHTTPLITHRTSQVQNAGSMQVVVSESYSVPASTSSPGVEFLSSGATSAEVSSYLLGLAKYSDRGSIPTRFGSYVFNDSVGLNVSVNWQWVRENNGLLTQNVVLVKAGLSAAGLTPYEELPPPPAQPKLLYYNVSGRFFPFNTTVQVNSTLVNTTLASITVEDAIGAIFGNGSVAFRTASNVSEAVVAQVCE